MKPFGDLDWMESAEKQGNEIFLEFDQTEMARLLNMNCPSFGVKEWRWIFQWTKSHFLPPEMPPTLNDRLSALREILNRLPAAGKKLLFTSEFVKLSNRHPGCFIINNNILDERIASDNLVYELLGNGTLEKLVKEGNHLQTLDDRALTEERERIRALKEDAERGLAGVTRLPDHFGKSIAKMLDLMSVNVKRDIYQAESLECNEAGDLMDASTERSLARIRKNQGFVMEITKGQQETVRNVWGTVKRENPDKQPPQLLRLICNLRLEQAYVIRLFNENVLRNQEILHQLLTTTRARLEANLQSLEIKRDKTTLKRQFDELNS